MTAKALLSALRFANVRMSVVNDSLVADGIIPTHLADAVTLLHVGVRGILTEHRWYGYSSATGRGALLDPAQLIPAGIDRLCIEGDPSWDCIPSADVANHPELWATPQEKKRKAA
ncbi:hypothetical protein BH11PLA2_BH11PLA2_43990 [soil metagenome]